MSGERLDYRKAGVDIDRAESSLGRIGELARATHDERVLGSIGGFGGLYALDGLGLEQPVLVASTDGVGTKLKLAFMTGRHTTVGEDLVNHCVNDILVQGARPLFFLDYYATGRLSAEVLGDVVEGIARGCRENRCALLGGETAEMPGLYSEGEYDLAGTIVGVVERRRILPRPDLQAGDLLLGLPAVGLHTNGYSLARKVLLEHAGLGPADKIPGLELSVADALLLPHPSYLRPLWPALEADLVKALAHVTGGGIPGNLPRALPRELHAEVDESSWPQLPLFETLERLGGIEHTEMRRVFNMGLGMIAVVARAQSEAALGRIREHGSEAWVVGELAEGAGGVRYR